MPRKKKIIKARILSSEEELLEAIEAEIKIEKLPVDCVLDNVRVQEKINEIIDYLTK